MGFSVDDIVYFSYLDSEKKKCSDWGMIKEIVKNKRNRTVYKWLPYNSEKENIISFTEEDIGISFSKNK